MDMKKEMTRIALAAAGLLFGAGLFAQQDPHFTMYMFNKQVLNPGYVGSKGVPYFQALYRNQWVGIEGAPKTINAGVHGPVGQKQKVALGVYAMNDRLGIENFTGVYGQYAYRFQVGDDSWLSLGLQAGATRYQARFSELIQPTWAYPNGDPLVSTNLAARWLPNFGFGAYLMGSKFFMGVSVPHLVNNQYDPDGQPPSDSNIAQQYRHLFAMAGVRLDISEKFAFQPQFQMKYVPGEFAPDIPIGSPLSVDFDLGMIVNDIIMFGVAYRGNLSKPSDYNSDSFDAYIKAQLTRRLELGYAYDLTISDLSEYTSGSHEVMVALRLAGERIERVIGPRQIQWTF